MLSNNKMYKPIAVNDATTMIRNTNTNIVHDNNGNNNNDGKIEYVTVTAPTNLPGGYELVVDTNGSFWTVQVVRICYQYGRSLSLSIYTNISNASLY
jgi:hypothetical protein